MLEIAEEIKQRFRGDNNREETVRTLELSFFNRNVDTLYPSNDLYPSGDLFPADAGSPWLTIGMDRICAETLSLTESLSSGDNIVWGSCESAKLTLTVADVEDDIKGRVYGYIIHRRLLNGLWDLYCGQCDPSGRPEEAENNRI